MNIPKSFQLGGSTIIVSKVDDVMEGSKVAWCDLPTGRIRVSNSHCGTPCTTDYMEASFNHELVHAILQTMGKYELNKDEEFVEGFANLLHQFTKTAKYE